MSATHQVPMELPAENWVLLSSFALPMEAELARGRLLAAGIDAKLADQHTVSMAWHLADAMGGIKLQVVEEDLERARIVLESEPEFPDTWEADALDGTEAPAIEPIPGPRSDDAGGAASLAKMKWSAIWLAVGCGAVWTALRSWLP